MRRPIVLAYSLAILASTGCPTPTHTVNQPTLPDHADGAILERQPCPVRDYDSVIGDADERLRSELEKSGLLAELTGRPIETLYPREHLEQVRQAAEQGACQRITYRSAGLRVTGFVMKPTGPGPFPAILYARGGNADFGKVDALTLMHLQQLVNRGFVVLATQYRGADGGEGADEFGGADVDDLLNLIPLARSQRYIAGDQLYFYGRSRGVMQVGIALRRGADVRGAILVSGVYDAQDMLRRRPRMLTVFETRIPGFAANPDQLLARRSILRWPDALRVPLLIIHAQQDWRTPVEWARALDAVLTRLGHPHQFVLYDPDHHGITLHRPQMVDDIIGWIREIAGPAPAAADPAR